MYFRFRCICLFPCQTFRLFILQFMWSLSLDQIGHWSQERKVQSPSECQQLGDVMSKNFVRIHFGTLFRSIATGKIRRRIRTDYHLNPYNFAQRSFSHTGKHWNIVFFFVPQKISTFFKLQLDCSHSVGPPYLQTIFCIWFCGFLLEGTTYVITANPQICINEKNSKVKRNSLLFLCIRSRGSENILNVSNQI